QAEVAQCRRVAAPAILPILHHLGDVDHRHRFGLGTFGPRSQMTAEFVNVANLATGKFDGPVAGLAHTQDDVIVETAPRIVVADWTGVLAGNAEPLHGFRSNSWTGRSMSIGTFQARLRSGCPKSSIHSFRLASPARIQPRSNPQGGLPSMFTYTKT